MNTTKQQVNEEEEENIPFLAIGTHELDDNEEVGEVIICPHCNQKHKITYGTDEDGKETKLLSFYKCKKTGKSYIAGVAGKLL